MAEYPLTITTNDGLDMMFKTRLEHVEAYKSMPTMFRFAPEDEEIIIPSKTVDELMRESQPMSVSINKSYVPPKRRPGRPRQE